MSLYLKILKWSESSLSLWQRDALRRLVQAKSGLSSDDYDQLYSLLKTENSIPVPDVLAPIPLSSSHLPAQGSTVNIAVLKAMSELINVNRIKSENPLSFSPKGVTIIYGANAAGKSGYARVLKHACRARNLDDIVHPDAMDPKAQSQIPQATFDIELNGNAKQVTWKRNEATPEDLTNISVFDSHCARSYLVEGEVAYLPYGLDILTSLADEVMPELSKRLQTEIGVIDIPNDPFPHLGGDTAVGKMIAGLSAETDLADINKLATLSKEESLRLVELKKILLEPDPGARAKSLKNTLQRIQAIKVRLIAASALVSDEKIKEQQVVGQELKEAESVELLAAKDLRSGEDLLEGTGEKAWRKLFEAARSFSIEAAYPKYDFPHVDSGALCLFCQQKINAISAERIQRFEAYIRKDAAKQADEKRLNLTEEINSYKSTNVSLGLDEPTIEELATMEDNLATLLSSYQDTIKARHDAQLDALIKRKWDSIPGLIESPLPLLDAVINRMEVNIGELEDASNEKKKLSLQVEHAELLARTNLALSKDAIISLINRMKRKAQLEACKIELKTTKISYKAKELASDHISNKLTTELKNEFKALDISHIKPELAERTDKGKNLCRLLLGLPDGRKLDEILSEGEQRAIAIGSFFAELGLAQHSGGIVFDDPVSSLDRYRSGRLARRLVAEADKRQVIIFTHDSVFMSELLEEIKKADTEHYVQFVEWRNGLPGSIVEGLPWMHLKYKEKIDCLEKELNALRKSWPPYPGEKERGAIHSLYNRLRATIERVVQDVALAGVVRRYENYINVSNLNRVIGFTEDENNEIQRLQKKCHDNVDAHDSPSGKNAPIPAPDDLLKDIADLRSVIKTIIDRQNT